METKDKTRAVIEELLCALAREGKRYIPAAVSGRHVHLSEEHIGALFGSGHRLQEKKPLSQPGQYACEETVEIRGSKGSLRNIRVLGPARKDTQVEISVTDSYALGIKPAVRMSGDVQGTPGCVLVGPCGEVALKEGVMVSKRHLHMSGAQAAAYGLKDKDVVDMESFTERPVVLKGIVVRSGEGHDLELHIDTDEANAAAIRNGDYLEIV